jgi:DNA-binding IclR family transcriptional regulator
MKTEPCITYKIPPNGIKALVRTHPLITFSRMNTSLFTKPPAAAKPGISTANRSLERGIDILRAFRPGSALLGNGEISERTGLSKSTVSRLTQTLVASGVLQIEPGTRVYRLAPLVLSLAHAMRTGSKVLALAAPLMRSTAEKYKVNVGLASADQDEMVYLESIRYNRRPSLRTVVSGQRVPMELTSLGRAYLSCAPESQKMKLLEHFKASRGKQWPQLKTEIETAERQVKEVGFCMASWQPEVIALATPIEVGHQIYALNVSVSSDEDVAKLANELFPVLLDLKTKVNAAMNSHD